ncbi:hypothetical protein PS862_03996 [Pseudomonas fluorescens]|uniref:Uncharacterized protein n=1 Tax=Pseudomonas fluorescens TaxID=294 RepID=A0A5E7MGI4_PSEFL|nr:hypothetical protein PS862_03996 [Pseudomonas fluorescens]
MGCIQFGRLHKLRLQEPQLLLNRGGGQQQISAGFFVKEVSARQHYGMKNQDRFV